MAYQTKAFREPIPADLLDLFVARDSTVYWSSAPVTGRRTAKRAPWGSLAGGKPVIGRGALVTVSGYTLLTSDILFALEHAYEWAWQVGDGVPALDIPMDNKPWIDLIRSRFALVDGSITWAVNRGWNTDRSVRYPAGSPVQGLRLSGFRGSIATTSGTGLLFSDIEHVLEHGCFPWQDWN